MAKVMEGVINDVSIVDFVSGRVRISAQDISPQVWDQIIREAAEDLRFPPNFGGFTSVRKAISDDGYMNVARTVDKDVISSPDGSCPPGMILRELHGVGTFVSQRWFRDDATKHKEPPETGSRHLFITPDSKLIMAGVIWVPVVEWSGDGNYPTSFSYKAKHVFVTQGSVFEHLFAAKSFNSKHTEVQIMTGIRNIATEIVSYLEYSQQGAREQAARAQARVDRFDY